MTIKLPVLESELYETWEQHVEKNPMLKNSPPEVREAFEKSVDDLFSYIILFATL